MTALTDAIERLERWVSWSSPNVPSRNDLALVLAAARAMAADASDEEMAILMPAEQGDMVRRLRDYMRHTCNGITCKLCDDAATHIEALEAALRELVARGEQKAADDGEDDIVEATPELDAARKALAL